MSALRLIVGLGNPGPEHAQTRHNAGFRFVDALAERTGARWGLDSKLFGETAKAEIAGHTVWLLKPATFMNLSGKSITAALRFWKIEPEQLLVAHDELDLAPGTARLKFDGGHGGLHRQRQLADLVEQQRAAVGCIETTRTIGSGAREGAFDVAEQLAFQQLGRNGGSVERNKRFA